MMHTPSAVYHFNDGAGEKVSSNKVNAIFQAAKKDLLRAIPLQVKLPSSLFLFLSFENAAAVLVKPVSITELLQRSMCSGSQST